MLPGNLLPGNLLPGNLLPGNLLRVRYAPGHAVWERAAGRESRVWSFRQSVKAHQGPGFRHP